jgi:hypothetical protein
MKCNVFRGHGWTSVEKTAYDWAAKQKPQLELHLPETREYLRRTGQTGSPSVVKIWCDFSLKTVAHKRKVQMNQSARCRLPDFRSKSGRRVLG